MTIFEQNSLLSSANWSEEQLYLKEFVFKHGLPAIVRVTKGQYMSLGVSSLANPMLQSTFLMVGLGRKKWLVGQSVKFKDNRKVTAIGPKLALPASYDGYFEILNEDGKSVRCIESVAELLKRFPDSVLVREAIKAYLTKGDDVSSSIRDNSRIVKKGETLILVGEATLSGSSGECHKFLRCLDTHGENVYLPLEMRGKFSAIAKEDNISGVHTVENLLNKRLPLMARLVHGSTPIGMKSSHSFAPELRLMASVEEESVVAMTLNGKEPHVVPLPLPAPLKLQYLTQHSASSPSASSPLSGSAEFLRLHQRCLDLAAALQHKIIVRDVALAYRDLRLDGASHKPAPAHVPSSSAVRRPNGVACGTPTDEYDEIEQIYDYVRGFAPLPKTARGWKYEPQHHDKENSQGVSDANQKPQPPQPPPLDTLPSRKATKSPAHHQTQTPQRPPSSFAATTPETSWTPEVNCSMDHSPSMDTLGLARPKPEAKKRLRFIKSANCRNVQVCASSGTPHLHPSGMSALAMANGMSVGHKMRLFRNRCARDMVSSTSATPTSAMNGGLRRASVALNCGYYGVGVGSLNVHPYGAPSALESCQPILGVRYKSMTDLAAAANLNGYRIDEYDTLDSSGSGGKTTSGNSGGGSSSQNRLPEKRSRKLSRPKSLTNLVWGGLRSAASKHSLTPTTVLNEATLTHPGSRLPSDLHLSNPHPQPQAHAKVAAASHSKKLGASSKRIGTLYL